MAASITFIIQSYGVIYNVQIQTYYTSPLSNVTNIPYLGAQIVIAAADGTKSWRTSCDKYLCSKVRNSNLIL